MMQSKWGIAFLVGAVLSWFVVSAAFAAPTLSPGTVRLPQSVGTRPPDSGSVLTLEPSVTSTITSTVTPTATVHPTSTLSPGNEKIAQAIANYFGVGEDIVLDIHDQAHGWGQVFFVFALANKTGESPEDIWAMRQAGEGWGQIFTTLGLEHGLKRNNLGGAITGRPTPTGPSSTNTTDSKVKKGEENPNKGGGNPNVKPTPYPLPNPNANPNSSGNNGRGRGRGPR